MVTAGIPRERYTKESSVIFSHSSARALTDHPRNVPDDVLERLPETLSGAEFLERVRQSYRRQAAEDPGRWRIIDAAAAPAFIHYQHGARAVRLGHDGLGRLLLLLGLLRRRRRVFAGVEGVAEGLRAARHFGRPFELVFGAELFCQPVNPAQNVGRQRRGHPWPKAHWAKFRARCVRR